MQENGVKKLSTWLCSLRYYCYAAVLVPLGGCAVDGPQSTLLTSGPVARIQADVFYITLMVCLGIFVATGGLLAYAVWRFRARHGQEEARLAESHGNPTIEFTLIGIVMLLLLVIAVPNLRALLATYTPPAGEEVLQVQAVGHQWWWNFTYPEQGVVTANELHIPIGRPVQVELRSADVIHSFWIPKLAGKMDLIPNKNNALWFQADVPGVYFGQCAEFCGASHANMRFRVVAASEEEFQAWITAQRQPAEPPTDTLTQTGADLFVQKGCIGCHAVAGTLAQGVVGPNLTHFGSRQTLAAGIMENTPENLHRWLKNPLAVKPASLMPNLGLTDADIAALTAYLYRLK
jgi:cytochrome c oxidase subunit 2